MVKNKYKKNSKPKESKKKQSGERAKKKKENRFEAPAIALYAANIHIYIYIYICMYICIERESAVPSVSSNKTTKDDQIIPAVREEKYTKKKKVEQKAK